MFSRASKFPSIYYHLLIAIYINVYIYIYTNSSNSIAISIYCLLCSQGHTWLIIYIRLHS